MLVWVWNILVTYHDVTDLHIHGRLYEYMYVRLFEFMSTLLYVHVTYKQHTLPYTQKTHTTHQGFAHVCLDLYSFIFETVSRGSFMCDVRCTAQICSSWYSFGIEGAGVRKCLSLSERGGTTS